jgi:hypothetical protein
VYTLSRDDRLTRSPRVTYGSTYTGYTHLLLLVTFLVLARRSFFCTSTSVHRCFRAPSFLEWRVTTGSDSIVHSRSDNSSNSRNDSGNTSRLSLSLSPDRAHKCAIRDDAPPSALENGKRGGNNLCATLLLLPWSSLTSFRRDGWLSRTVDRSILSGDLFPRKAAHLMKWTTYQVRV